MSKRKFNPIKKVRKVPNSHFRLLSKSDSGKVSVELPTADYKNRFFPSFLEEEALSAASSENFKLHHLGFQFLFREEMGGDYLQKIELYWIIYYRNLNNPANSAFFRYRMRDNYGLDILHPNSINTGDFIYLKNDQFFSIEQYKNPGQTHSHYDIAGQPIDPADVKYNFNGMTKVGYRHFDFFEKNTDIDFVYFTRDQLRHFFDYYEKIRISGSQIVFGKQLTHRKKELLKNYEDNYFTLKIEGQDYKGATENIAKLAEQDDEPTYGTEVATGQPCPPRWHSFSTTLQQLNRIYSIPIKEVQKLSEAWNTIRYEKLLRENLNRPAKS